MDSYMSNAHENGRVIKSERARGRGSSPLWRAMDGAIEAKCAEAGPDSEEVHALLQVVATPLGQPIEGGPRTFED